MKAWLIISLALTLISMSSSSSARDTGTSETKKIPIYKEMHLVWQSTLKKGIIVKEYCSNQSAKEAINFYKSSLTTFIEIEMGTAKGRSTKLLLDVESPGKWRKSEEFIEILQLKKEKPKCKTTIYISSKYIIKERKERKKEIEIAKAVGFGVYVNTVNLSTGPTLILWPTDNLAIQGTYGTGTFTSFEVKALYRFNINSNFKPYLGAGYIHAEKKENVLGNDKIIDGESFSAFIGSELRLTDRLFAHAEVSGTPLEVETEFISGSTRVKASVNYSAVTINVGLVYYLW